MASISAAGQIFASTFPVSFSLHASTANTINLNVSTVDPSVVNHIEELLPGQSLTFEDFVGSIWGAPATAGTVTFYLFGTSYEPVRMTKGP